MSTASPNGPGRNRIRMGVDLVMAVTFVLLLNARVFTGLSFHEVAGTLIGGVFVLHVGLNWTWVVETTRRWCRDGLGRRTRFGYVLNGVLLLSMAIIGVSGVLISRVVFPEWRVSNARWIQGTHITLAFLILGVVGIHVGLHWGWIRTVLRRIVSGMTRGARVGAVLGLMCGVVFLALGSSLMPVPNGDVRVPSVAGPGAARRSDGEGEPGRMRGEMRERSPEFRAGRGRRRGSSNALGVVVMYLGIMGVFASATVWVERRFRTGESAESLGVPTV